MTEEEIAALLAENRKLRREVDLFRAREKELADDLAAAAAAREKADGVLAEAKVKLSEAEAAAEKLYDLEADRLRLFKAAWDKKFAAFFVGGGNAERLNSLAAEIDDVVCGRREYADLSYKSKVSELRRLVDEKGKLISDSAVLFGDGEDGFSLDDILDPKGDLDLASLCREMGLSED